MHMISRQLYRNSMYCRARFTKACASFNPLLALKNYCEDLLKTSSEKLAMKMHGQLFSFCFVFAAHLIAYAFVGVSILDLKCMWVFKLITQHDLLRFVVLNLLVFVPLLNILCLTWLQLLLPGRGTAENREGREFFPLVLIYLECQRKTLSEHIDLTVICAVLGRSH